MGQYFDQETSTHYNYFRDYDSSIGRYGQSDPIGLHGGLNTYNYAFGSPVAYIDPEGASYAAVAAGAILGGIGGGLGAAATGGNIWQGVGIGVAVGAGLGLAGPVLPSFGALVVARIGTSAAGNLAAQGLNMYQDPCVSFNTPSFVASIAGGYVSGIRATAVVGAGLPTSGVSAVAQRTIAGTSGAASAATIGIIGTSIGQVSAQQSTNCCDPATSSCCSPRQPRCCGGAQ